MLHAHFVEKMFALLLTLYEQAIKAREIYFHIQHGFSEDSKNFYLQYRISGEQRTDEQG